MTWRERVAAARINGTFSAVDKAEARCWPTCAVGEQHTALPDVVLGHDDHFVCGPVDEELSVLGSKTGFVGAVESDHFARAEECLDAIEDRVLQLKRGA